MTLVILGVVAPQNVSLLFQVAEGSADLGITAQPREDHAHYLANWLAVLKNDKTAISTAAAAASKAAEYLHALQSLHAP